MNKPTQPDARGPKVGGCTTQWSEKLFWYVNETLPPEEVDEVEGHLGTCPECGQEVAELRLLREAVQERAAEAPEPSEAVFRRVMERIEAHEAGRLRPGDLWRRLTGWIPSPELLWQPALRPAVAVAGLLILVQAAAIAGLLAFGSPTRGFRTLAGPPAVEVVGPRAKIAFRGAATEQAIRNLLREVEASIVEGPSALGLYTIALPAGVREEAAIEAAFSRLRAREDIVRFVERLP